MRADLLRRDSFDLRDTRCGTSITNAKAAGPSEQGYLVEHLAGTVWAGFWQ